MRIFQFVNERYGIENIRNRRLKISTIMELNDPFELHGIELSGRSFRRDFQKAVENFSQKYGILCFSQKYSNPVQWSHYADKHKGICLGFDVPDEKLLTVSYSSERAIQKAELTLSDNIDQNMLTSLLSVKYYHWNYEHEVRRLLPLSKKARDGDYFFEPFSADLKLKQVIVGARSTISRIQVLDALDSLKLEVEIFKARLAFKSFRVVRNSNEALWK